MASGQPATAITDRALLAEPARWSDAPVQLLIVPKFGGDSSVDYAVAKTAVYASRTASATLSRIQSPLDNLTYVVAGNQSFYIADPSGIVSCIVGMGDVAIRRSVVDTRGNAGEAKLLEKLVSEVSDAALLRWWREPTRVDLRRGVPPQFWTARGGLDQQGAIPKIDFVGIEGGILRLALGGAGGRIQGSFLIDLASWQLLKTVIDDRTVFEAK